MNSRKVRTSYTQDPRDIAVLKSSSSLTSEQYRVIRTNILFAKEDGGVNSVLFTSDVPAAGKSTTATNVAVTFAQAGKKTILVDADLRRPTSHYTFGLSNQSGLTTGIVNNIKLEDLINETAIKNLDLITSGPVPPNPSELLSSKKMEDFLISLRNIYDMVIVDSPPLIAVTDAQILSKSVEGTIIVTNVKNNNRDRLFEAKQLLEKSGANILGVVLNKKKLSDRKQSYYHSYGSERL